MGNKKVLKILAGAMAMAIALSGCGNSKGGGTSASVKEELPTENVELRFSWWGSDDRHEAMKKVVDLYMAKNPNVKITVEYGAWDSWQSKVLTQLSGKTEPDVLQVNYNWVHSFGKGSNVFYDLNELSNFIDLKNWDQDYLNAMTVDGQLGAVPHGMTGRLHLYNKALFEEYGLKFPATYDELIAAADVIGADNTETGADNKYVFTNIAYSGNWHSTDLYIAQMLYNKTGKLMQENGKVNYTIEEVAEILDRYKSFEDSGAMPKFQQDDPIQNESNPVWTSGRSGSVYEWVGTMDKYIGSYKGGEKSEELGVAPYITEKAGDKPTIYVKPNLGYAVSKNSKNPEVAADFINFMFTNEDAVKALGTSLGISSNTVTRGIQEADGMLTGITKDGYELLDSYEQVVMDPYFEDENVRGQRYTAIEAFRSGKYNSQEAAKDYVEKQQVELDKLYK